jgi:PIN domain nuclease of toxin-antitoxin system
LLLDTHVVLWWLTDDPTLADQLKETIDQEIDVFVSAVTVWEVTIKQQLGKITAPADLPEAIRDSDLANLPVTADHAVAAGRLPLVHRDPFDRVMVAQALTEGLTLVTRDKALRGYDVPVLSA